MTRSGWMWVAAGLGLVAGMRSMTAPAVVSWRMARQPRARPPHRTERTLSSPRTAGLMGLLALAEEFMDKRPETPARTRPPSLAARAASGAVTAAAVAERKGQPTLPLASLGAVGAVAGAYAFYALRKRLGAGMGLNDALVGLGEDAIALISAVGLTRKL